jgi:hypothetical protein
LGNTWARTWSSCKGLDGPRSCSLALRRAVCPRPLVKQLGCRGAITSAADTASSLLGPARLSGVCPMLVEACIPDRLSHCPFPLPFGNPAISYERPEGFTSEKRADGGAVSSESRLCCCVRRTREPAAWSLPRAWRVCWSCGCARSRRRCAASRRSPCR